jgi:uroporphyrinogen-III decarboxylase
MQTARQSISSRERMLAALRGERPDHVPCCFMIFTALRGQCSSQEEYLTRQLDLGLDAYVEIPYRGGEKSIVAADVPGLPVAFDPSVVIRRWSENRGASTVLHKTYETPAGPLHSAVRKTHDWPYGEDVPLFDDYLIPRSEKFLITTKRDLAALARLLRPPTAAEARAFRDEAAGMKRFAAEKGLLVASGWGVGLEAGCWLCGIQNLILHAVDQPDFVEELTSAIAQWNQRRMNVVLDAGIDLFVRRGWYEGTDFWSPPLFERFVKPHLAVEAALAHGAGARFGYIMTSGSMALAEQIKSAGVDVLIGVDPVQGKGTDMARMKQRFGGSVALWGGVNGFLTIERGTEPAVAEAVRAALATLGPAGFILSPVDNVRDTSEASWRNVRALVRAWQEAR